MKKISMVAAIALALTLSLGMIGCSNGGNDQASTAAQEQASEPTEETLAVIDGIDSLGEITLASKEEIDALHQAYGKLPAAQKKLVTNYETLKSADKTLIELENTEKEKSKAFAVGETVTSEDFSITLNDVTYTETFNYPTDSFGITGSTQANSGARLLYLTFTVEALNSKELPIIKNAITNLVATVNGNTYKDWTVEHLVNNVPFSYNNSTGSLSANLPETIYAYVEVPASDGSITVDMTLAGQAKQLVVQ